MKEPVQFRTAKNVGLIAGGTGKEEIKILHQSLFIKGEDHMYNAHCPKMRNYSCAEMLKNYYLLFYFWN